MVVLKINGQQTFSGLTAYTLTTGGLLKVEQTLIKFCNFFRLSSSVSLKKRNKIPNSTHHEKNKNKLNKPLRIARGYI